MAKVTQYVCDGCGAVKGDTNHWWLGYSFEQANYQIAPFEAGEAGQDGVEIYCGDNCLHKALTAWTTVVATPPRLDVTL